MRLASDLPSCIQSFHQNTDIDGTLTVKKYYYSELGALKRNHCHHIAPSAWLSRTVSRHPSLSSIASGGSLGLHPVSAQSCCKLVLVRRPVFARPCEGVLRSTSLMSSFLLLQQCPACLVRLAWIVFVIGSRWPYSCFFVGCCLQNLFNIARSILVFLPIYV